MSARNQARKRSLNPISRRRNERTKAHQLDVRMRSKKEVQLKTIGFFKQVLKAGCVVGAIVATFYSSRWVYNTAFYENDDFALTDLRVETDGILTHQRIVAVADVREGVNLVAINIEALRERLSAMPQVKGVEVIRQLPNRLAIKVEERVPVAWLSCPSMGIRSRTSQRGFMLDADGVVIPCEALLRKYLGLPVIQARALPRVKPGAAIDAEPVTESLRLIARSNELFFDDQIEIREVEIRNDYSLRAFYNNDAEVTFGLEDIEEQLSDLKLILAHSAAKNRHVATLNLMARKNIPITYFNLPPDGIEFSPQGGEPVSRPGAAPAAGGEGKPDRMNAIRAILGRG